MPNSRFYDNLAGFSDLKYEAGNLYGRLNGGSYVLIPTRGEDGNDGQDGADGTSAYVYHAFASDSSGTGFTLIDDGTLAWTSWITTNTPIANPSLADFTVWVRRKGVDGASAYVYVAWASDSSGTGFSLTPSAFLPYRAELHTSTPIVSPTLADFSGVPFVDVTGISEIETEIALRKSSTAYSVDDRVLYPGKTGYTLLCTTAGTSAASAPSLPVPVISGTSTLTDGTAVWTIYDATAPEIATVNGLSAALAGKANTSLSNLTAHTAIDTTTPVDFIICSNPEPNGYVRIWKSGWVEQFFFNKKASGSSSAWTAFNFYVAFASEAYSLFDSVGEFTASSAIAQLWVSYKSKSSTGFTAYLSGGSNRRDFYACGQGDTTSINQYISSL